MLVDVIGGVRGICFFGLILTGTNFPEDPPFPADPVLMERLFLFRIADFAAGESGGMYWM